MQYQGNEVDIEAYNRMLMQQFSESGVYRAGRDVAPVDCFHIYGVSYFFSFDFCLIGK